MSATPRRKGDEGLAISLDGTTRPILTRNNTFSPTKTSFDPPSSFNLQLEKVIGTTTTSVCGFDYNQDKSCFVTCAGSVVVWNEVDSDLKISQRFFRAHPSASPVAGPLDAGTPTKTNRRRTSQLSPIRPGTFGVRNLPSAPASPVTPGTPGKNSARQGSRAAACISLSDDGKTIAVGEVGYNPQIYLFSCLSDSQCPIACLSEHTYGVKCVSLSGCGRWLASVGDIHDGFILVWALGTRMTSPKIQCSNRCTSTVNAMTWMGKSVVTVGVRHVKVWRPDLSTAPSPGKSKFKPDLNNNVSPSPVSRALNGRNCILGSLLESNFTCVRALSETRAVVGTDKGEFCLLDDTAGAQSLRLVRKIPFAIHCITIDYNKTEIWAAGGGGQIQRFDFGDVDTAPATRSRESSFHQTSDLEYALPTSIIVGLAILPSCLVALDSSRCVKILQRSADISLQNPLLQLPSHENAVLDSASIYSTESAQRSFMTYDSNGSTCFWSAEGDFQSAQQIPLDQLPFDDDIELNELKVVRMVPSRKMLVSGDKYGILRLFTLNPWTSSNGVRLHQGELNDLDVCQLEDGSEIIASCGRDRIIQVFDLPAGELQLLQTIEQHASSVTSVAFGEKGKILLSASADRTIGIHALATSESSKGYLMTRVLTLKQTPVSLVFDQSQKNVVHVTTMDKQIYTYDTESGQNLNCVKITDEKQSSVVLLSSLLSQDLDAALSRKRVLIGISPTDKSIRIHDLENGTALAREYGHSEGFSSVVVIAKSGDVRETTFKLVSTGLDGTIMLWTLTYSPRAVEQSITSSPVQESPAVAHPLRRVLSRSAFADLSKSLEADGVSPVPQSIPSRGSSPTRARNRLSIVPAATITSKPSTPRLRRAERSPSPPLPSTPTYTVRRPLVRTRSVENFNSLDSAALQLCRSLRDFQRKFTYSSTSLNTSTASELEKELTATISTIGLRNKRNNSVGGSNVGELLDQYAHRLAQLVEEKVSVGLSERTAESTAAESASLLDSSESQADVDGGDYSPKRLERVPEMM